MSVAGVQPEQQFVVADASAVPGCRSLVGYASRGQPRGIHLGVPSTSLTLILILSLAGPVVGAQRPGIEADAPDAGRAIDVLVSGLDLRATAIAQPSDEAGVQLAIDPLAARALFGRPAGEIARGLGDPEALGRAGRQLWQRVGEAPDWAQRFALVGEELRRWSQQSNGGHTRPEVAEAWRHLKAHRGAIGVEQLATHVALSARHLRTEFEREFGMGPKAAARLIRFEHAMGAITTAVRTGRPPALAEVAARCGYADQSHLVREVRGFLGVPPSEWVEQERRNIQAGGHHDGAGSNHG